MEGLGILFDKESPCNINDKIVVKADSNNESFRYKFIIGNDGIWSTVQEFSDCGMFIWKPKEEGKYMIMVQAKDKNSKKPFDCIAKQEFIIGEDSKEKLIKDININNTKLIVGDKLKLKVVTKDSSILYRFWIKRKQEWELIRDYTTEDTLIYTANKEGNEEILIECKKINSTNNFDEFTTVKFDVISQTKIEITDFKCLTKDLLVNEEIIFKVKATLGEKRSLLYKFIKIDENGRAVCIQDYSSLRTVTYQEKEAGKYRLLCLVKDILSNMEYDDRAIMIYYVKPYNDIRIKDFTPDIRSPQINGRVINIKANVEGGRELLYRYIIDGPISDDTGYIRRNEYNWETKQEGEYKITLLVKDISFDGEYEDKKVLNYIIDKKSDKPIRIDDVIIDREKNTLVGQPVNFKVIAEGGISLSYSFVIYKDNKEKERIDFSKSNWFNFIPKEKGEYDIEVMVKDKYSNKEYDSNTFVHLKVRDYLPGKIDYILLPHKDHYIVGDTIEVESIVQNTKNVLMRYITKINGYIVEDTGYIINKKFKGKLPCSGKYTFEVYAKNEKCHGEFDSKKEFNIYVSEANPVTNTKIFLDKELVEVNKEVTFSVDSNGGKDVCYEFYIMEKGNWIKAQNYGRKKYYTFIPFLKGEYRVMVLSKSFYKKVNYEDYDELNFIVS